MKEGSTAATMLKWGLAFVFFYAGLDALIDAHTAGVSPGTGVLLFSVYEIVLAAWLFSGKKLAWTAIVTALTFAVIFLVNLGTLDTSFWNVGLAMAALALFELAREKNFKEEEE